MGNPFKAAEADFDKVVAYVKDAFKTDKAKVAADVTAKVSEAMAAADEAVKDATPEVKAAAAAAAKLVAQAVLDALKAHGLGCEDPKPKPDGGKGGK